MIWLRMVLPLTIGVFLHPFMSDFRQLILFDTVKTYVTGKEKWRKMSVQKQVSKFRWYPSG